MNKEKKPVDKSGKRKSPDTVETPTPPQHMDPSKKPTKEDVTKKPPANPGKK